MHLNLKVDVYLMNQEMLVEARLLLERSGTYAWWAVILTT